MFRKLIPAIITLTLLLAACAPAATPTAVNTQALPSLTETLTPTPTQVTVFPLTLTDGLGRKVEFSAAPQRIVSLTPSGTEVLFAVGAGSQVVGRDTFSDYPDAAKSVTDIGGSMGKYDSEAIVNLKPDLVLAGGINPQELVSSLENLGLKVYFLANPLTLENMYANLELVGKVTGHLDSATTLVTSLNERVATVDAKLAGVTEKPLVYYELDATPYTAGPGTFIDLLIQRAGGTNFGSSMSSAWAQISLEQLVVADPAMIILGDAAYGESATTVAARQGWSALTAVKDGKIFSFDDNLVSRPGPRLVDGLEQLARLIHPEAFK